MSDTTYTVTGNPPTLERTITARSPRQAAAMFRRDTDDEAQTIEFDGKCLAVIGYDQGNGCPVIEGDYYGWGEDTVDIVWAGEGNGPLEDAVLPAGEAETDELPPTVSVDDGKDCVVGEGWIMDFNPALLEANARRFAIPDDMEGVEVCTFIAPAELASLRAERDESLAKWTAACDAIESQVIVHTQAILDAEDLRSDRERLDFLSRLLENHGDRTRVIANLSGNGWAIADHGSKIFAGTLREAIDAARSAGEREGETL